MVGGSLRFTRLHSLRTAETGLTEPLQKREYPAHVNSAPGATSNSVFSDDFFEIVFQYPSETNQSETRNPPNTQTIIKNYND